MATVYAKQLHQLQELLLLPIFRQQDGTLHRREAMLDGDVVGMTDGTVFKFVSGDHPGLDTRLYVE